MFEWLTEWFTTINTGPVLETISYKVEVVDSEDPKYKTDLIKATSSMKEGGMLYNLMGGIINNYNTDKYPYIFTLHVGKTIVGVGTFQKLMNTRGNITVMIEPGDIVNHINKQKIKIDISKDFQNKIIDFLLKDKQISLEKNDKNDKNDKLLSIMTNINGSMQPITLKLSDLKTFNPTYTYMSPQIVATF